MKPEPAAQQPKWVFGGLQPGNVAQGAMPALPQPGAALLPPQQLAGCQQTYLGTPVLQHQPPAAGVSLMAALFADTVLQRNLTLPHASVQQVPHRLKTGQDMAFVHQQ